MLKISYLTNTTATFAAGRRRHLKRMNCALLLALLCVPRSLSQTVPATTTTLDTRACQPPFDALPFCNTALSLDERVDDLIERLWAVNASNIPFHLTARNFGKSALPALGLPEYDWGLNCIHGVQSSCVLDGDGTTYCPTSFSNPVNFGNAWNKSLAFQLGAIIGVETRALWLAGAVEQSPRNHIGLDTWSPNINIARDPRWVGPAASLARTSACLAQTPSPASLSRFPLPSPPPFPPLPSLPSQGRNQEVCGEDPLINGDFGSQYTQGLQVGVDPSHLQAAVTLKHVSWGSSPPPPYPHDTQRALTPSRPGINAHGSGRRTPWRTRTASPATISTPSCPTMRSRTPTFPRGASPCRRAAPRA